MKSYAEWTGGEGKYVEAYGVISDLRNRMAELEHQAKVAMDEGLDEMAEMMSHPIERAIDKEAARKYDELCEMPVIHFTVAELAFLLDPWGNFYSDCWSDEMLEELDKIYNKVTANRIKV